MTGINYRLGGTLNLRKRGGRLAKLELSPETERTLGQARLEAVRLGHAQVGSEHLLLALLTGQGTEAGWFLRCCGWEAEGWRAVLRRERGSGQPGAPLLQGLTTGARQTLQEATREAERLQAGQVLPEHLLLALLRREQTMAVRLLRENGTDPELAFSELIDLLRSGGSSYRPEERGVNMRLLEQFCEDMVASSVNTEPVIGRDEEIETVMGILCRKNKNNPALIGEPGVGKTAIVEGLAQRIAGGKVPELLQGKRLLSVNLASVLAGTKYRGEFEERVRDILLEVRRSGNIILFVDEMHTLVGAGSAEGAIDAANLLKPALGRGEIQLIGATTLEEYRKHIEKDAALERRFRPVMVREPSKADALLMLEGLRPGLERHHQIRISQEALEAAVELSCRYLTDHFLPDKAVDLLDEAAARSRNRMRNELGGEEHRQNLTRELSLAVQENRFEQAASLRDKLQQLLRQQRGLFARKSVEREDIAAAVAQRTGIPVGRISQSDRERLAHLEEDLQKQVMGQEEATRLVASAVCRGRMGLADSARPVASLLFLGPTGVGKTALCKALADCVYGSRDALVRLDMSEYMEQHAVSRLLGAPPGYIGHGEGGELTEKVRRRPYCVVLLDELEKAHRDVTSILLQVLEDGVLTDSMGRHVDFRNTIIVMTSNLGSGSKGLGQMGFEGKEGISQAEKALREFFSPEFLGRLDCVATFQPLSAQTLQAIARKELEQTATRARGAGIRLSAGDDAVRWLAEQCAKGQGGARDLRRKIRSEIETPAARRMLTAQGDLHLQAVVEDGKLQLVEAG